MTARKKAPKPEPRVVHTICSICGEDWSAHQEVDGEVSTLECVRLLKAKLASRPATTWWLQTTPWPYTQYTQPIVTWQTSYTQNLNSNMATPVVVNAKAAA